MISTIADIVDLLELEPSQFIPEAYESIIGRAPDVKGVINYAQRLDVGLPRLVMLSELYSSREGQAHRIAMTFSELDEIFARCLFVRNLRFGKARWLFLPRVKAKRSYDSSFDWCSWAGRYIEGNLLSKKEVDTKVGKVDYGNDSIQRLEERIELLALNLQKMKENKSPDEGIRDQIVAPEVIDQTLISWNARQSLLSLHAVFFK